MEIFEKIGNGSQVVFIGYPIEVTDKLKDVIYKNNVMLFFVAREYYSKFYNSIPKVQTSSGKVAPAYNLNNVLKVEEYRLIVEKIIDKIKDNSVKYVLLNSNMWHPKYLKKLKDFGITLTTKIVDDPEGSDIYSKPIVQYYDKCICSGVYYDKKRTIEGMYYKWGAKNVKFLPVFIHPKHYDYDQIDYEKKDIDIIHVGSFNWKRWMSLSLLYRNFGEKIKFYSHYDPRNSVGVNGLIYKIINLFFPLPRVEKIGNDELKAVYKRSKIGFNRHLSYGPSNARSYELCLNGILQVTDNPDGYKKIYSVGREIICYRDMKQAIKIIKYYLYNKKEREEIARAGYNKAVTEYTYEEVFNKHLKYILKK